jgi:hypothetical protein
MHLEQFLWVNSTGPNRPHLTRSKTRAQNSLYIVDVLELSARQVLDLDETVSIIIVVARNEYLRFEPAKLA